MIGSVKPLHLCLVLKAFCPAVIKKLSYKVDNPVFFVEQSQICDTLLVLLQLVAYTLVTLA